MHMQIDDDFVHETSVFLLWLPSPAAISVMNSIAGDGDASE
jgi:hypothetical protein